MITQSADSATVSTFFASSVQHRVEMPRRQAGLKPCQSDQTSSEIHCL